MTTKTTNEKSLDEKSLEEKPEFNQTNSQDTNNDTTSTGSSDTSSRRSYDLRRRTMDDLPGIRRNSGTALRRCSFCSSNKEMEQTEFCPRCICIKSDGCCAHPERHMIRTCSGCDLSFQDLTTGEEKLLI